MDNCSVDIGSAKGSKIKAFFKTVLRRIRAVISQNKHLLLSALLPMALILLVYALIGIFPFGKRSILTLDMNAQYIYYFEQLRDILTGNGSLIYTWERALGGEFLGFFTYYVASPLSLILVLFPPSLMVEGVTFMMILKCGISGLCFAIYLDKTGRKRNAFSYATFSIMYALCGYAMAFQSNTMWMDALMWLPLLTLGIERLVTDGKFKLFTVMLALIIWSNYYIGYMACIYTLVYFICFICAHKTSEINNLGEKKHILKSFIRIAISSIVALLMVMVIILTAYYSISFGKTDGSSPELTFTLRFDFLDFIAKMFIGSYDTVRPAGLPNVYSGILALFMLPMYFLAKKIPIRQKVSYGILTLFFIASMSVNALDLIWHGFQMPVWLNYRYCFMFSFIILIMAYKGFELFAELEYKNVIQIGAMLMMLLLFIQKTVLLPRYDGSDATPTMPDYELVWISFAFIFIYLVVLYYKKKEVARRVGTFVLLGVVSFEACVGAIINWGEEVNDVGWSKRSAYRESIDNIEPTVDMILESDTSFYRMEKTLYKKPNENFALDIRGLTSSTSTFNRSVMNLMQKCGFPARSHWSKYFEGNELVDSIFGIKYVISDDKTPVSHTYTASEGLNGLTVYQNKYALPIAYCADIGMKELPFELEGSLSPIRYLEYITKGLIGSENFDKITNSLSDIYNKKFFNSCYYSVWSYEGCTKLETSNFTRFTSNDSKTKSYFTYVVTAPKTGSIYMYLTPSGSNEEVKYYINDSTEPDGTFFSDENTRIQNLGNFTEGERIYVKFEFESEKVSINTNSESTSPLFVQLNEELYTAVFSELSEGGLKITDYSSTSFEGTVTAEENEIVTTTIPYDKYWKVYVDGERVETYTVLDTLLAFDITPGEHTVELKYSSTMFNAGLAISLFGLALFVVMCVFEKRFRIRMGWDSAPVQPASSVEFEEMLIDNEIDIPSYNSSKKQKG